MTEDERLERLEEGLRTTQNSILLMSKDMHQMNTSITSIASSMKTLVEVQRDLRVMEERNENRHIQLKEKDKDIDARLQSSEKIINSLPSPSTAKWIIGAFMAYLILFGIYTVDTLQKNKNQITYLKGRIK